MRVMIPADVAIATSHFLLNHLPRTLLWACFSIYSNWFARQKLLSESWLRIK